MGIQVDNLAVRYDGGSLFDGLSFTARPGQKVCLQGRSGSGKSTLLKALMGFVVPDSGRIAIDSEELTGKTVWTLRHKIAYVSQEPDLGDGNVLERIRRPFAYHANAHISLEMKKVHDYCDTLYLDKKLLTRAVSDLSGGEKQRFAIIIALLLQRPILLLDEPISAQDKHSKAAFKQLLINDASRTVLFVSHEEALLEMADQTVDLDREGGHE